MANQYCISLEKTNLAQQRLQQKGACELKYRALYRTVISLRRKRLSRLIVDGWILDTTKMGSGESSRNLSCHEEGMTAGPTFVRMLGE